jgi:hypothetical protein
MNPLSIDRAAGGLGRPLAVASAVAAAAGVIALVLGLALGRAVATLAALDASFLFFAGLAAGSVALAAVVRVAQGRWAGPLLPIAEASAAFFAPALVLLAVLALGARALTPWGDEAGAGRLAWFAVAELLAGVIVFALGARFLAATRAPAPDPGRIRAAGVVYLLGYAVGLSVWAFGFVTELSDAPPFTVVPPYYFMGAFLSGLAWVALVVAVRDISGPDLRHDVGKLLFGFIVVWSYLLWSLFLPTWYGNIPEESAPLLARWSGAWKPITAAVLVAVFAWPFWLLFSERLKRRRATLAAGASAILLGLWAERFLLVVPSLQLRADAGALAAGAGVTLGVAGVFLLSVGGRMAGAEQPAAERGAAATG